MMKWTVITTVDLQWDGLEGSLRGIDLKKLLPGQTRIDPWYAWMLSTKNWEPKDSSKLEWNFLPLKDVKHVPSGNGCILSSANNQLILSIILELSSWYEIQKRESIELDDDVEIFNMWCNIISVQKSWLNHLNSKQKASTWKLVSRKR